MATASKETSRTDLEGLPIVGGRRRDAREPSREGRGRSRPPHFEARPEGARRQGALAWELRVATSLARLYHRQDQPIRARKALAPVVRRFTEGFKTAVLVNANVLLRSLR